MMFTTLISVPLLALAVSSLPILPDSKQSRMSAEIQDSMQVVFRLRSSHPDDFYRDAGMVVGPPSAAADDGYLLPDAVHGSTNTEGLVPFGQRIMTVISSGDEVPTTHNLPVVIDYGKADFSTSVFTLFLVFSCTIALLALACVGLRLYAIKDLHTQILWSYKAWQSLLHAENYTVLSSCRRNSNTGTVIAVTQGILNEKSEEPPYFSSRASALLSYVSITTSDDSQEDSEDEKFHDALDILPSLGVQDPSPDSPLRDLSSPPIPTALDPTPDDRPTLPQACVHPAINSEARELPARPSWSVRVASSTPAPPSSPLIHPRSRAYRAVPEFDIALAMQLRPGRGVGADPAWMVRFLMAIFGWFAVALAGNK